VVQSATGPPRLPPRARGCRRAVINVQANTRTRPRPGEARQRTTIPGIRPLLQSPPANGGTPGRTTGSSPAKSALPCPVRPRRGDLGWVPPGIGHRLVRPARAFPPAGQAGRALLRLPAGYRCAERPALM